MPKVLRGSVVPFRYNQFKELERIIRDNQDIGVIIMEVERSEPPAEKFLENVRALATKE